MKVVIQRVKRASVRIEGHQEISINSGLLVLAAFRADDTEKDIEYILGKLCALRIFEDDAGKMNFSVIDTRGEILIVPQFTLYGSCLRGNRPDFLAAASGEKGLELFEILKKICLTNGYKNIKFGKFRESMEVELINSGPVTLIIESADKIKRANLL